MENTKEFLRNIPRTFNPDTYVEFSRRSFREAISYFISLVLVSFFVMILLFLPKAAFLPSMVSEEFQHFDTLRLVPEINMTAPFTINITGPFLRIDTTTNHTARGDESILITRDKAFFSLFFKEHEITLDSYEDVKGNQEAFFAMFWMFLVLMMPSLLFLLYIFMLVKYLAIILLFSVIAYGSIRLAKRRLGFKRILNIGLYGSTVPLAIEAITRPYLGSFYQIPLIIFIVYFSIAVILNADR
ncbi:MAG: DUF1189 domain-containing protein [DPANN group archaeon]|nr:DUF1189 domain-containing protein [DPANN group archaeon]